MMSLHDILMAAKLAARQAGAAITIDAIVTENSANPVKSSGIYSFVNSSVSTNTAHYIGKFNSVAELEAYTGTVTNNDYAFVEDVDAAGNTVYNRYKYNDEQESWLFEYALNNSSFTANQWAAINSGLSAADKATIDELASALTPMTQEEYDSLPTKDLPIYLIYET